MVKRTALAEAIRAMLTKPVLRGDTSCTLPGAPSQSAPLVGATQDRTPCGAATLNPEREATVRALGVRQYTAVSCMNEATTTLTRAGAASYAGGLSARLRHAASPGRPQSISAHTPGSGTTVAMNAPVVSSART